MQVHKTAGKIPGKLIPQAYIDNFPHQANTGEIKMVKKYKITWFKLGNIEIKETGLARLRKDQETIKNIH